MLSCSLIFRVSNWLRNRYEERYFGLHTVNKRPKFIDILKEDEIRVIYTVNRVYMTL